MPSYQIIDSKLLNADITYRKPRQLFNSSITLDDPAIDVMTDFTTVTAISVNPCASLATETGPRPARRLLSNSTNAASRSSSAP